MRLKSAFFVQALMRRAEIEGAYAVLRRRGAEEAGTILVKIDRLDGTAALYGPAPMSLYGEETGERRFVRLHEAETVTPADAEARIAREIGFDPDVWVVEIEDRAGRCFLDIAPG